MFGRFITIVALTALVGCADTAITQLDTRTVQISTSAAPACGRNGAIRIGQQAAAIETIKLGFDKFVIAAANAQNNTQTTTTIGYNPYGGFYPQTMVGGTHDSDMVVTMFHDGEAGSERALSAKATLGPDWQKRVEEGVPNSC